MSDDSKSKCSCSEDRARTFLTPMTLGEGALIEVGTFINDDGIEAKRYRIRGTDIYLHQVFCGLVPNEDIEPMEPLDEPFGRQLYLDAFNCDES